MTLDNYTLVIIVSAAAFFALAAALLIPVYRFMRKEDQAGKEFDESYRAELQRRLVLRKQRENGNGQDADDDGGTPVDVGR